MEDQICGDTRRTPDSWESIASFVLLGTVGVLAFIVQPALVQGFVTVLGFSEAKAVDLAGIEMAGIALSAIVLAIAGGRGDWRRLTVIAILIAAAGNLASVLVLHDVWLGAARFVAGLGHGAIASLSFGFVGLTRRTDRNLAFYLVLLLTYGAVGVWLAPTLFATIGLEGIFLSFAVVCLASLLTIPFLPRSAGEAPASEVPAYRIGRPLLVAALAGVLVYNLAQGIAWANLFLIGIAAGLGEQTVANALFLSQLLAIGGALGAIVVAERAGRQAMIFAGILGGAACIALLPGKPSPVLFLIGVCGFNFFWNLVVPFILGAVNDLGRGGGMMRIAIAMQMIGLGGGPIVSARLIGDGDFTLVEWVCIGSFLISLALLVLPVRWQSAVSRVSRRTECGADGDIFLGGRLND